MLRALGLAHHWPRLLDEGRFRSMTEIAAAKGIGLGQASKMSRLAQLSPDLSKQSPWDASRWASASCCAASCRRPGWPT